MTSEPGAIRSRADGMSAAWVATASARPLVRVVPALAALAYPALIWAGPAIASPFLGASLIVPAVGVVAVRRSSPSYPWSGCVALLAVASPPLYSWLGGLLDFQKAIPVNSLGAWCVLWTSLAVAAGLERPRPVTPRPAPRVWHSRTAVPLPSSRCSRSRISRTTWRLSGVVARLIWW